MSTARRYVKKPVEVRALQFDGRNGQRIIEFIGMATDAELSFTTDDPPQPILLIRTLEGVMRADVGTWIIQGVAGEFYPCQNDIFEQSYDLAEGIEVTAYDERQQEEGVDANG